MRPPCATLSEVLFDASAVIAWVKDEAGAERVQALAHAASVSAVNWAEILGKLATQRMDADDWVGQLQLPILPFGMTEAEAAARLISAHRGVLSLGDAACIATAELRRCPVLTADRVWATLPLGIEVRLIRP